MSVTLDFRCAPLLRANALRVAGHPHPPWCAVPRGQKGAGRDRSRQRLCRRGRARGEAVEQGRLAPAHATGAVTACAPALSDGRTGPEQCRTRRSGMRARATHAASAGWTPVSRSRLRQARRTARAGLLLVSSPPATAGVRAHAAVVHARDTPKQAAHPDTGRAPPRFCAAPLCRRVRRVVTWVFIGGGRVFLKTSAAAGDNLRREDLLTVLHSPTAPCHGHDQSLVPMAVCPAAPAYEELEDGTSLELSRDLVQGLGEEVALATRSRSPPAPHSANKQRPTALSHGSRQQPCVDPRAASSGVAHHVLSQSTVRRAAHSTLLLRQCLRALTHAATVACADRVQRTSRSSAQEPHQHPGEPVVRRGRGCLEPAHSGPARNAIDGRHDN